jgi:predicted metal-dependent hydrolase
MNSEHKPAISETSPEESLKKCLANKNYFKLHDLLETIWLNFDQAKALKFTKLELQGAIQLTVSLHHQQNKNAKGFEILLAKAKAKLPLLDIDSTNGHCVLEKFLEHF